MARIDRDVVGSESEGEITFADVIDFLRRNRRFIALLTVVFSALAVALVLLRPGAAPEAEERGKEVYMVADFTPGGILATIDRTQLPSRDQIGNAAMNFLEEVQAENLLQEERDLGGVTLAPWYDGYTQRIWVDLQSSDEKALARAPSEIASFIEVELSERYERSLEYALEVNLLRAERDVETAQVALDRVEQRAGQAETSEQQLVVEFGRANAVDRLAEAEAQLQALEQTREDLPRLTAQAISVDVVPESDQGPAEAQQLSESSPGLSSVAILVPLAVASSFVAAVALALAREALAKRRKKS